MTDRATRQGAAIRRCGDGRVCKPPETGAPDAAPGRRADQVAADGGDVNSERRCGMSVVLASSTMTTPGSSTVSAVGL